MKAPRGAFALSAAVDFDFDLIAAPFRMQPGLRRLGRGARHLTRLDRGSPLFAAKQRVLQAGASRQSVPGFDESTVLHAIAQRAHDEGLPADGPPELLFEEDFALLEAAGGTLPWLCVCVPSHWAPEDKVGLDFAAVHAPVADNRLLLSAGRQLVQLATSGDSWERHVWTVTPSPLHDMHPRRAARPAWPDASDADAFAQRCFLRAERQTFFPMPARDGAVFTIRVMLEPLAQAVDSPAKAVRLHDALASMSDPVLAYKGLSGAREPLLRWLAGRTR
jgi:hypothetical protein